MFNFPPPKKPYMIALGTSHTNGDCTDGPGSFKEDGRYVSPTAYDKVAEKLGLELVNIGLSGCSIQDKLQATNELAHHGFFKDNYDRNLCKLFILEPRITDATIKVPIEMLVGDKCYKDAPSSSNKDWFIKYGQPTSMLEGWTPRRDADGNNLVPVIQQVSHEVNISVKKKIDMGEPVNEEAVNIAKEFQVFYANSPVQLLDHLNMIDAIKNIVTSNNIKFAWQVVTSTDNEIDLCKKLLGPNTDLFDYFINIVKDSSILNKMPKDYVCTCGHFSEKGHEYWYNKTIEHLL